jgi:hypothetical protein
MLVNPKSDAAMSKGGRPASLDASSLAAPATVSVTETRELVGRAVAALPALREGGCARRSHMPKKLAQVVPESSYSPSHIAGKVGGADPNGRELAFALNGRIVSTARSFAALAPHRLNCSTMLALRAFRHGAKPDRHLSDRALARTARPHRPGKPRRPLSIRLEPNRRRAGCACRRHQRERAREAVLGARHRPAGGRRVLG